MSEETYSFEKCKVTIHKDGTIKTDGDCTLTFPEVNAISDITTKIRWKGEDNGQN